MRQRVLMIVSIAVVLCLVFPLLGKGGWDQLKTDPLLKTMEIQKINNNIGVNLKNLRQAVEKAGINEPVTIQLLNTKKNALDLGTFSPGLSKNKPDFSSIPDIKQHPHYPWFPGQNWLPGEQWKPVGGSKFVSQGTLIIKGAGGKVHFSKSVQLIAVSGIVALPSKR